MAAKRQQKYTATGWFRKGEIVSSGRDLYRVTTNGIRYHEDCDDAIYRLQRIPPTPEWTATLSLREHIDKIMRTGINEPGSRRWADEVCVPVPADAGEIAATWIADRWTKLYVYASGIVRATRHDYDDQPLECWMRDQDRAEAILRDIAIAPHPFEPKHAHVDALFNEDGYDRRGFDRAGNHRDTGTPFQSDGYDIDGYDRDGRTYAGYDRNGLDHDGYNRGGYDVAGYDREGYDRQGFDVHGYDHDGYSRAGYDFEGYDRQGCDRNGRDRDGLDRDGYDREGYGRQGFDRHGRDRDGRDRDGNVLPSCTSCGRQITSERLRELHGSNTKTCSKACTLYAKERESIDALADAAGYKVVRPEEIRCQGMMPSRGDIIEHKDMQILVLAAQQRGWGIQRGTVVRGVVVAPRAEVA